MGVSEHGVRHLGHLHLVLRRRHLLHRRHDGGQRGRACLIQARQVKSFAFTLIAKSELISVAFLTLGLFTLGSGAGGHSPSKLSECSIVVFNVVLMPMIMLIIINILSNSI